MMYEAILCKIDAVANFLGLASEDRRIQPGVNPWGHTGGGENVISAKGKEEIGMKEKKGKIETHSAWSSTTLVVKDKVEVTRT